MKLKIMNFMETMEIYANNENIQIHIIKENENYVFINQLKNTSSEERN